MGEIGFCTIHGGPLTDMSQVARLDTAALFFLMRIRMNSYEFMFYS